MRARRRIRRYTEQLRADLDPADLLFSRSAMRHIRELIVGGRTVTRDGKVLGVDYPAMNDELLARLRSSMTQNAALSGALRELEHTVTQHYQSDAPCC